MKRTRTEILGIRTRYKTTDELLDAVGSLRTRGLLIQLFNPDTILNKNHLLFALSHARASFARKKNIAKKLETEILLRAAGTHKIDKAIELVGVKNPKKVFLLLAGNASAGDQFAASREGSIFATNLSQRTNGPFARSANWKQKLEIIKKLGARRDDSLLKITNKKTKNVLRAFGIDAKLLKSYSAEDLLLEKLASLDVFI
ncbi:MAG: KEOPS complex subunit Cgi121 [Candidatus Micrarchaeota archaeon]